MSWVRMRGLFLRAEYGGWPKGKNKKAGRKNYSAKLDRKGNR